MSEFIDKRTMAEAYLAKNMRPGADEDQSIAAAHVWALLTLAEALREVANAVRDQTRKQ